MNDIRVIHATNGGFAIVDADLFPVLNQRKWYCGKSGHFGSTNRPYVQLHRVVNNTPDGIGTDHINRFPQDNTRRNLRNATKVQNGRNQVKYPGRLNCTSKFKGVHFSKKEQKWVTRISVDKKEICIGRFETEREAALAYNKAAAEHYGEFACPNKVEDQCPT